MYTLLETQNYDPIKPSNYVKEPDLLFGPNKGDTRENVSLSSPYVSPLFGPNRPGSNRNPFSYVKDENSKL